AGITSLVFSLLIYAIVLSFGDLGKGAVVVVMVLQIAGTGGSFPVEILPPSFLAIYLFFPFSYAINAMREAICGTYGIAYGVDLARLGVFAVVALAIGLLVRKPFMGVNDFLAKRLEETEVL
ncbi:MAG: YhgE/Pip domain-containing protein, partial [Lachnospiraceae bacterium]|nr:YhgE/Pip domain-containing protein [Lachnospiraceae bacterium]